MPEAIRPELVVSFDTTVYRLNAIKKAAYRFGDRCSTRIRIVAANEAEVTLHANDPNVDVERLSGEFSNEVLDQELREVVAEETRDVRNLLLAQAFSPVSLVDREGENADFESDPLGISRPDSTDRAN